MVYPGISSAFLEWMECASFSMTVTFIFAFELFSSHQRGKFVINNVVKNTIHSIFKKIEATDAIEFASYCTIFKK